MNRQAIPGKQRRLSFWRQQLRWWRLMNWKPPHCRVVSLSPAATARLREWFDPGHALPAPEGLIIIDGPFPAPLGRGLP